MLVFFLHPEETHRKWIELLLEKILWGLVQGKRI